MLLVKPIHSEARRWTAQFAAVRVTPAHDWRHRRLAPEVGLLGERDLGDTPRPKYYFVNLPTTASLTAVVRLAHQRWAIEQQYQDLKTELGLDHFEGRSFPGWHHHVVLTAITYNFLQAERHRLRTALTRSCRRSSWRICLRNARGYLTRIEALTSPRLQ